MINGSKHNLLLFFIMLLWSIFFSADINPLPVAAQSTGDTLHLPPQTPASTPAARPTFTPALPAEKVWVGRLVSNTPGATDGQGSIFRVSVQGMLDTPIELRSGTVWMTANSGTKPEYGPFAAEFAPVTKAVWTVSVPALGVAIPVEADNYNLAVIEFAEIPAPEATRLVIPTNTPTPLTATNWKGRLAGEIAGKGEPFSRLLVHVAGRDNQLVRLSTISQELNTAATGQKPDELGPNMVEFAGLTPGKYIIDAVGLNASLAVELKPNTVTRIEFHPTQPAATPTPASTPTVTPLPFPTATQIPPTNTPLPTPTSSATPTATLAPAPSTTPAPLPTPINRWIGVVTARAETSKKASSIIVTLPGIEGIAVRLNSSDGSNRAEKRCVTGQGNQGQDTCLFENLSPGWYWVSPEGIDVNLPVSVSNQEATHVSFGLQMLPPGVTGWTAHVVKNENDFTALQKTEGRIRVSVAGKSGQMVALRSNRLGATRYCEVINNPVLGKLVCEFGQLGPGVYQVEALHTNSTRQLFVDGASLAEIEFTASATVATENQAKSPAVVGRGAMPRQPAATATATVPPIVKIVPATTTPTATPTSAIPTRTPTPAFAWQGRILETKTTGAGAIGVRAAGLKDHPVIVRSGGWQSRPQLTGTKPELGDYATEFGGLAQGEYLVELVDLAQLKVNLGGGEFMLVEFKYDFVTDER